VSVLLFALGMSALPTMAWSQNQPQNQPTIPASEYQARRAAVAKAIGPHGMLVLLSPTPARSHGDEDWPFRQQDDLLYLTGVDTPDTHFALLPGESEHREVLFTQERDPLREMWTGPVPTFAEQTARSGVAEVVPSGRFDAFLAAALGGGKWGESELYRYYRPAGMPALAKSVRDGLAEVWLLLGNQRDPEEPTPESRLAEELRRRWPQVRLRDASPLVAELRAVKSPAEIALLERAIEITGEAQKAAMRRALSAEHEYEVQATIDGTFRALGACCPAFPTIVGAGRNGTILHYETNAAAIPRDALVLVDIGAELQGYAADVTRTFPADGSFSPAQREVYRAVYAAQEAVFRAMKPGALFADLHALAATTLGEGLLRMGLVSQNVAAQVKLYFPHGLGHPIGLEVHDVFDPARPLEPGMVVTNEPGIYVRRDAVEASATFKALGTAEQVAIRAALARYDGIGVRIEDDALITADGCQVLSTAAPRTVEAIEAWQAASPR
jgi:Xaa-Pro aminopeptidase